MNELPKTRQSLLLRLSERSGQAWHEFVDIYEKAIYQYCRGRGLQDADARDVTQEVLTAVDKRVHTWKADPSIGSFRGWLFRVARNVAVDVIREKARKAAASGDTRVVKMLAELPESEDKQASAFWLEYRSALMHWAAQKVKPDVKESTWQSFWRTAVEGQKPEIVAEQLGISVGSVYTGKCRVVARIRKMVQHMDDHLPSEDDELVKSIEKASSLK